MGLRLQELYPEFSGRDCGACRRWHFDESGKIKLRAQRPIARPQNCPPDCAACPKTILEAEYDVPQEMRTEYLSERNQVALKDFLEAHYAGPTILQRLDPIWRRNAAIIGRIRDEARELRETKRLAELIGAMFGRRLL